MSSDSGSGRHKPRRKATRARGSRPNAPEPAPTPPPEPPRYAPRGGESPFWANAQPRTDSQAWADTQAHLEARTRTDSTPQYAPRPVAGSTPLGSSGDGSTPLRTASADSTGSRGWVTQSPAPTPAPEPTPAGRPRQSTPAEDLAGLGAWATPRPERPTTPDPAPTPRFDSTTPRLDSGATAWSDSTAGGSAWRDSTSSSLGSASVASARSEYAAPGLDSTAAATSHFESTPVTPSPSYTQPPAASVADPRTARGTSELSGPRTAAIRESKTAASRPPRQAADSAAVDADGRPLARTAGGTGRKRRPFVAVTAVLLVVGPISWILLHQPPNDNNDASLPIGTRTDDSYVTPSTVPVDDPTVVPKTPPATPTAPPPTGTPTTSVTPTTPPTGGPTETPTTRPTDAPTSTATTRPTAPPTTSRPTSTPTGDPTNTPPPPPPPPPAADGDMTRDEIQLFNRIDSARKAKGCAPLEQDAPVTYGARNDAASRSESGDVNDSNSSMSAAGGDDWSSDDAFDQMMTQSKGTILNCGLRTLGVGHKTYRYCKRFDLLGLCVGGRTTRVSWVADFS